jgi:hypothetical protein
MTQKNRLSASVPSETDAALEELAQQWGVSKSMVISKLIGQGLVVERLVRDGGEIICRLPDGREEILLRGGIDALSPVSRPLVVERC